MDQLVKALSETSRKELISKQKIRVKNRIKNLVKCYESNIGGEFSTTHLINMQKRCMKLDKELMDLRGIIHHEKILSIN